jgi:hypothetical protein
MRADRAPRSRRRREVNERRDQRYQLLWRERIGFARLALE